MCIANPGHSEINLRTERTCQLPSCCFKRVLKVQVVRPENIFRKDVLSYLVVVHPSPPLLCPTVLNVLLGAWLRLQKSSGFRRKACYRQVSMQYFIFDSKAFNIWTTWMLTIMTTRASWNLRSILDIDEVAQTISLDATIRFQWRDPKVRQSSSCGGE